MRMRHRVLAVALIMEISLAHAAPEVEIKPAAPTPAAPVRKVLQELYGGVVVNQTVTVAGQDFYQYFVALWRDKEKSEKYVVSIHERPSARWGTQVWVEYAQKRVFQSALPTARANIQAVSAQAVDVAYQNVIDVEIQSLLFRDVDLGPDEM
jgi:curli production assembly/transport component CsgE